MVMSAASSSSSSSSFFILYFFFFFFLLTAPVLSRQSKHVKDSFSFSFPLTAVPIARTRRNFSASASLAAAGIGHPASRAVEKTPLKYSSVALTVSLPVGTPPQVQEMVLDTGSQLSWVKCHQQLSPRPPSTTFDPSLSSSFSAVPCNHPVCKPRVPDYTIPTTCDQNRLCHYSYFYADGTLAEGNLVSERLTFTGTSQSTPPLVLGCATSTADDKGILGLNLGRLSFPSQAKLSKFSYCVPARTAAGSVPAGPSPTGSFVLGANPSSASFRYVSLMTFSHSQTKPNLDPLAYTVPMQGIRIGAKWLDIPPSAFTPDAGGSGQTMIDSGSELTYLVDEAYSKVKEEIVRLVGPKMKKGYSYSNGEVDMCFDQKTAAEVSRLIGGMAFVFRNGVEISVPNDRVLAEVERGVHCLAIGMSNMLGAASNIIGNFHQQSMWIEFDLVNRRVGLGKADCSRA
ncbi:hypothetical protein SAY87_024583 [Trapa incisa]|uniref:Peptidase A1 domain-containing protein n=1 Tax=Trapa incisa TaxID=236973 RepID=A0AAN7JFV9_9MYRT|nr:hypothetical protein SAY87_024583 [Trapa incisa]